jgi:NitT/TauT family transport system substrate-binding protein
MPSPFLDRRSALGLLTAVPLAATIFGAQQASAVEAQDLTTLRVGVIPIDPCTEIFSAIELGSFKKAGLDIQLTRLSSGAAIAAAIAGGALDMGLCDLVAASAGRAHGLPFVYVSAGAVYTPQAPGHALMAKNASSIRGPKDFAGKTIAVSSLHSIDEVTIQAWIDKGGGDWKSVKWVEMPDPAMAAALDSDSVDAIVIKEPAWTLTNGRFRSFEQGDAGIADRFLISGYLATQPWASAHADLARTFATIVRETGRWANGNHAASAAILAKYTSISPDLLTRMERSYFGDRLTPGLLQPLIDAGVKYGAIPKTFPAAEIIFSA